METRKTAKVNVPDALVRFQTGDHGAFDLLIDQFHPLLSSMTARFCHDPVSSPEWEEWYQEARIALFRAACTYKIEKSQVTFGSYARVCVRNAFVDRHRRAKNTISLSHENDTSVLPEEELEDPLEELVRAEDAQLLYARIASLLSPLELKIFDCMVEGMAVPEIAKQIGNGEKSVSNAIYRLTVKLQKALRHS